MKVAAARGSGVFMLSFDLELIWGTLDIFGPEPFREKCETERRVVIDRLLRLLEEFEIPATWFVVGHLMLDRCNGAGPRHPEIVRPAHAWVRGDWFRHDPGGGEETAPLFLARGIVEKIRSCRVRQEIGCHSFSHVIFGDAGCSRAAAASDVAACVRVASELGIPLRSFAFPRNSIGHLDVLEEHGFSSFRGPEPRWYANRRWPGFVRRAAHIIDVLTTAAPPVVLPERTSTGLWNVPGSMIYLPSHGIRRYIPVSLRVRRALKGLDAAVRHARVFHLWLHPTNLVDDMDALFDGLHQVFTRAAVLRESDALVFRAMSAEVDAARAST
jgi:peptidoglycan/xylan/chitin deacetylase (PgdA/CDA1 family)